MPISFASPTRHPTGILGCHHSSGGFAFRFFTIENVEQIDADHIIVGSDNNPLSWSVEPDRQDDGEFVLLAAPDLLRRK